MRQHQRLRQREVRAFGEDTVFGHLLDLLEDLLVHCAECVSVGRVAPSGDRASCALEVLALGVLGKGVEELSRLDVRLLKCLGESD